MSLLLSSCFDSDFHAAVDGGQAVKYGEMSLISLTRIRSFNQSSVVH